MKTLRIFALLLILALSFSILTSCDVLEQVMGSVNGDLSGEDNNDTQKPEGDGNDDTSTEPEEDENITEKPDDEDKNDDILDNPGDDNGDDNGDNPGDDNGDDNGDNPGDDNGDDAKPEDCKHEWAEGVCSVCGVVCEHEFVEENDYTCCFCGMQAVVPPEELPCEHVWAAGVCQNCGEVCEHDFGYDVHCSICGEMLSGYYLLITYEAKEFKVRYESTLGEFISEHLGTSYEETVATGGYWMTVDYNNFEKVTLNKDSYLMNYGMVLELYLIGGGSVTPPVEDCEHEWVDDYCPKCGVTCQHSYVDTVCTICGKVCDHSWWMPGECGTCGLPCEHEWDGNWCVKCSYTCMHEGTRVEGVCTVCGNVCEHYWVIDHCEYCGMVCNHTFDGPTCTKCGYMSGGIDNPVIVTYEGQDYYIQYSASFELFLQQCLGMDYSETILNGYWVALTSYGEVTLGEYTAMSDFAPFVTIEFRANDIGGGDGPVNPADCPHSFDYGMCEWCGMPCTHEVWKDRWCAYCGYECFHTGWYGGVCDFCGYSCEHNFENGQCMMCNFHANDLEGTLTVYYNGEAYEVALGTTVSQFVNHYLYLDFEMSTYRGFWNLRTGDDTISVHSETYFCDYEGDLYLEYTEYAFGPF